jgi:hypothetical protein
MHRLIWTQLVTQITPCMLLNASQFPIFYMMYQFKAMSISIKDDMKTDYVKFRIWELLAE